LGIGPEWQNQREKPHISGFGPPCGPEWSELSTERLLVRQFSSKVRLARTHALLGAS
jgi:hypothetical protein